VIIETIIMTILCIIILILFRNRAKKNFEQFMEFLYGENNEEEL